MKRSILQIALMLSLALAAPVLSAEEPAFHFDGKAYFLRGDENGIREFLTKGENFEKWSTLISVREFPGVPDPRRYAVNMVNAAKAQDPAAQGQVLVNDKTGSVIADFLLFSGADAKASFAEWNLWRIEKKGDGIRALQYARRFYDFDEAAVAEIKGSRNKLIGFLAELEFKDKGR